MKMSAANFKVGVIAALVTAASLVGCGGGGAAGPTSPTSSGFVNDQVFQQDSNQNLYLNRKNGGYIATIVLKELLIHSVPNTNTGAGTQFNNGNVVFSGETVALPSYVSQAMEFAAANINNPKTTYGIGATANNGSLFVTCPQGSISFGFGDANGDRIFDTGDGATDSGNCANASNQGYTPLMAFQNVNISGAPAANTMYSASGTISGTYHPRFASGAKGYLAQESGTFLVRSSAGNQKVILEQGTLSTNYQTYDSATNTETVVGSSSHTARSISTAFTPGGDYELTGSYSLKGSFPLIAGFQPQGGNFNVQVMNLDLLGSTTTVDSLTTGSFRVFGASNTQLAYSIRSDGTFIFSTDENGDGVIDYTSGPIDLATTLTAFNY